MIYVYMILIFLIFFGLKIIFSSHVYEQKLGEDIYFFLNILLKNGIYSGNIRTNGLLSVFSTDKKAELFFSKYKERGKYGIYFYIPVSFDFDIDNLEHKVKLIMKKYNIDFFIFVKKEKDFIVIDVKDNFEFANDIFKKIMINVFDFTLDDTICYNFSNIENKTNNYDKNNEKRIKNMDLHMPIKNYSWIYSKIKDKFKKAK